MSKGFDMNLTGHRRSKAAKSFAMLPKQRGASLIMVMIILTIVSMIGIAGIQISTMGERGARNDRDYQLAWQSAEAGLMDAESDIFGPGASTRRSVFMPTGIERIDLSKFVPGCGAAGNSRGLCGMPGPGKPQWLSADFEVQDSTAQTTKYGEFTGNAFAAGAGAGPARAPRYLIELMRDSAGVGSECRDETAEPCYVYRVTAMGFGPRQDIQAVLQMIYRK